MTEDTVQLRVEQDADITIISILTPRIPVDISESFESGVVETVEHLDNPKVLLDFSSVTFISSAILGKLIKLNGRVRDREGQLRLCCLSRRIAEVFRITGLDTLFSIHRSRSEALKAFK